MILKRTQTLVATLLIGTSSCLALADATAETPDDGVKPAATDHDVNSRIQIALTGANLVREGHEAVVQAFDFHGAVVRLGEKLFNPKLTGYRNGQAYHPEYTLAAELTPEDIQKLQSGTVAENAEVFEVIKADLGAFVKSDEVAREVHRFYGEWRELQSEFRDFGLLLGELAPLFALTAPDTKQVAVQDLERTLLRIRDSTEHIVAAQPADQRIAMLATIYVIVSIFHNNDSRIALAFDNPAIVNEVVDYVRENIGDNALLDFARKYAMPMDSAFRYFGSWPYLTSAWRWAKDHPATVITAAVLIAYYFMPYGVDDKDHFDWDDFGDPPPNPRGVPAQFDAGSSGGNGNDPLSDPPPNPANVAVRADAGSSGGGGNGRNEVRETLTILDQTIADGARASMTSPGADSSDGDLIAELHAAAPETTGSLERRRSVSVGASFGSSTSPLPDSTRRSRSAELPFFAEFDAALPFFSLEKG